MAIEVLQYRQGLRSAVCAVFIFRVFGQEGVSCVIVMLVCVGLSKQ
jgi:hypothetical protein